MNNVGHLGFGSESGSASILKGRIRIRRKMYQKLKNVLIKGLRTMSCKLTQQVFFFKYNT